MHDAQLAAEESRRRAEQREKQREAAYAVAFEMRANGHSQDEIRERTGLSLFTQGKLFRGLGRRT